MYMYVINTSLRFLFEGPHGNVLYTGNLNLFSAEQVCNLLVYIITRCHVTFCTVIIICIMTCMSEQINIKNTQMYMHLYLS